MIDWQLGPANGNDPVVKGEVYAGDRFLVLVCVHVRHSKAYHWDAHVITATESGWDDPDGDTWGAWSWSDVEYFIKLDESNLPLVPPFTTKRAKELQ